MPDPVAAPSAIEFREAPDCNWGELTSEAIVEDDFDQGAHASGQDEPRAGLANVVEPGDMFLTCDFIEGFF